MFSTDFFRGENERPQKTNPQRGGANIKCNSPVSTSKPSVKCLHTSPVTTQIRAYLSFVDVSPLQCYPHRISLWPVPICRPWEREALTKGSKVSYQPSNTTHNSVLWPGHNPVKLDLESRTPNITTTLQQQDGASIILNTPASS